MVAEQSLVPKFAVMLFGISVFAAGPERSFSTFDCLSHFHCIRSVAAFRSAVQFSNDLLVASQHVAMLMIDFMALSISSANGPFRIAQKYGFVGFINA